VPGGPPGFNVATSETLTSRVPAAPVSSVGAAAASWSRRAVLGGAGTAALALVAAACGGTGPVARPAVATRGVVFNSMSGDVTLFDPVTNAVTGTHPVDAVVRWLSNNQRFWDGRRIWSYDFPAGEVQAIAIDPGSWQVVARVGVGGAGPAHSFVLSPDLRRGFVNAAGSDLVAVVDIARREVVGRVRTGAYP
jgi:hypothetical protein